MVGDIRYKVIEELEYMDQIVEIQRLVWGGNVITPVPHLIAAIRNGGMIVGAFDQEQNKLVGFCYGFPGFQDGQVYLYSHMLAMIPGYRNRGIGRNLKLEQREWALANGYEKMVWTFDPLEAKNAYLNLVKLGGKINKYYPAYYGELEDKVNRGLPSDRFILEWDLASDRVTNALQEEGLSTAAWADYPQALQYTQREVHAIPDPITSITTEHQGWLVPVPKNIEGIKKDHLNLAIQWRMRIRESMTKAFVNGYEVIGVLLGEGPVHHYVLQQSGQNNGQ